jgi:hypothetical protein
MRLLSSRQNTDYHLTVDHASFRFQPFQEPRPCIYCGLIFHGKFIYLPQSYRRRALLWDHQRRRLHSYCDLGEALLPRTVGESLVRDNTGNLLYIKVKYCHRDRGVHSGQSVLCARIRAKPSLLARRVISGDGQWALSRIFLDGSSTTFWPAPMLTQTTPGVNSSPEWIRRGGGGTRQ